MNNKKISSLIVEAIKENVDLEESQKESLEKDSDNFRILGEYENIDSLDLVSILADIEQKILRETNLTIVLSSDKAMSHTNSPFRDVKSLTEFILEEINQTRNE